MRRGEQSPPGRTHLISKTLIKFTAQKGIKGKVCWDLKLSLHPSTPPLHIMKTSLVEHFTCLAYSNGHTQSIISDSVKATITACVVTLALRINDFQISLIVLQAKWHTMS
jgi:DNA-directed RNA polymerase I subunit RPA49